MKLITTLLLFIGFFSWPTLQNKSTNSNAAGLSAISKAYFWDFRVFENEVDQLVKLSHPDIANIEELKHQITATRYAYKRIEFLFDYRHTDFNKLYINGGPLPKINESSADEFLIHPNGLQTLDELIFSEEAALKIQTIHDLAMELKNSVELIAVSHNLIQLSEQQIIESLRSSLVRIFTLGLTGFDTPGSGNAIEEAIVSLKTIEKTLLPLGKTALPPAKKKMKSIKKLLTQAQNYLAQNKDFDTFDRLDFLTKFINPLYRNLYEFQTLNKIETPFLKTSAHNYATTNVFDEQFLNTDTYSEFAFLPLYNPKSIALGKMLFYDPILSKSINMSCATCHDPKLAFTDGLPKSKASVPGKFTHRNAPTLIDGGYSSRYFWDLREHNLERQVAHVVDNNMEFDSDFKMIAERLSQSEEYVALFNEIYGEVAKKPIYNRSVSNAIAAYVNSLKSFNSEFDQYVRQEIATYPLDAKNGFNLFMGKAACGTCHFAPVFNGSVPPFYIEAESEVLGLTLGLDTLHPVLDENDLGRMDNGRHKEALPHLKHSFKTVTVRNAELTAPYMHNGLFPTLEDVIEFYNHGGAVGMGIELENQTLAPDKLNLTQQEKKDIITFIKTLTDTSGLNHQNIILPEFKNRPEWNNRATY
jgi:cytochrome c peroxidase